MLHLMALLWLLQHMWPHQRIKHGSGFTKLGVSTTQLHRLISGLEEQVLTVEPWTQRLRPRCPSLFSHSHTHRCLCTAPIARKEPLHVMCPCYVSIPPRNKVRGGSSNHRSHQKNSFVSQDQEVFSTRSSGFGLFLYIYIYIYITILLRTDKHD